MKMATFSHDDYEIIKKDVLYKGRFSYLLYHFRHRQFNGEWSPLFHHELLERPSAVAVLPYDPILNKIVLIEQFRAGAANTAHSPWLIEIVAGLQDANETNEVLAKRETQEEAGLNLLDLHPICDYFVSPGASNEYIHLYIGRVDASKAGGIHGLHEENEDIRTYTVPMNEAIEQLKRGDFKNAPTIIALQWLQLHQEWLRDLWQVK